MRTRQPGQAGALPAAVAGDATRGLLCVTNCPPPGCPPQEDTVPSRFWKYPCCSGSGASRTCFSHSRAKPVSRRAAAPDARGDGSADQLHFGWRPIGPHRAMGDPLFGAVATRCASCDGNGLINRSDGASYSICGSCFGFGTRPFPGAPRSTRSAGKWARSSGGTDRVRAGEGGPPAVRRAIRRRVRCPRFESGDNDRVQRRADERR